MNEDFVTFSELLQEATGAVESVYFQLPVAGAADAADRERGSCANPAGVRSS